MSTEKEGEPKRLDTEDESAEEVQQPGKEALEQSTHIHATREEAAWEEQAEDVDEDDGDDMYPAGVRKDVELEDDDFEDEEEVPVEREISYSNLDDIMLRAIPKKSIQAGSNLRAELAGSVLLHFKAKKKEDGGKYLFQWDGDEAKTQKVEGDPAEVDCKISVDAEDFFDIVRGKLNPQVAMLSDKIYVQGKLSLAVYFFNLFAI